MSTYHFCLPVLRNEAALFVREVLGLLSIYGNLIYANECTCFGTKMAALISTI